MKNTENYITLENGKQYYIDIEAIVQYASQTASHKQSNSETTEIYTTSFAEEITLSQKQIREFKEDGLQLKGVDNLRYSVINSMLEFLHNMGLNVGDSGKVDKHLDISAMALGEALIWNTFVQIGFIKEII